MRSARVRFVALSAAQAAQAAATSFGWAPSRAALRLPRRYAGAPGPLAPWRPALAAWVKPPNVTRRGENRQAIPQSPDS